MGRRRPPPRVRANRLNARKSTGPKTSAGKERASSNATLHGFSAKRGAIAVNQEIERLANLLCEGDARPAVMEAAREIAHAQFEINAIRFYRLILKRMKALGKFAPLPPSSLLDDPVVFELIEFVTTGEPHWLGIPDKQDHKLYNRIINFIYRHARRAKDPETESLKLGRYERAALTRRKSAIEKFDSVSGTILAEVAPMGWPRPTRPGRLPALSAPQSPTL